MTRNMAGAMIGVAGSVVGASASSLGTTGFNTASVVFLVLGTVLWFRGFYSLGKAE